VVKRNEIEEKITLDSTKIELSPNQNSLQFNYTTPNFEKYTPTNYQYILEGYNERWSDWNEAGTMTFENLPHGTYSFKARSRTGENLSDNFIEVDFLIEKPWFLSNLAVIGYIFIGLIFFTGINWFYKRYYRRQREAMLEKSNREMELKELEAQKEIIQLRNNHLNLDIEARNRELAISTMNMIKKNETLNDIKDELSKLKNVEAINPVMQIIDKNINNKEDWKFFEEAFNHADKDFFKKVKESHPQLTSNDLRLCVYLRMNLSSKEIAPLLNISPRSVEIKRYRLRKKIGLEREINLNDYFIDM
jgi:DNA-binding CsgD family transcriptional regulator